MPKYQAFFGAALATVIFAATASVHAESWRLLAEPEPDD